MNFDTDRRTFHVEGAMMAEQTGEAHAAYRDEPVLVTGGFGFIGGHLVARLLSLGARVTVIDIRAEEDRPSLLNGERGLRERVRVVPASIDDFELVLGLIRDGRPSWIFNLASYASTIERAMDYPRQTIGTNTIGLVNLLESVRLTEYQPRAIVHTSTDKVYGDAGGVPYDEETTPLRAHGVYDVAKLAADAFARMYHRVFELPTVVMRLCNIFGPHDYNTGYRVVPRAMSAIYSESAPRPPELYEESVEHARDYLYVQDCVEALLRLGTRPSCWGQVYNLMGCAHLKTPQMLEAVVRVAADLERETDPARAEQIERQGYRVVPSHSKKGLVTIQKQCSEGTRLRAATGFEPQISLDEGLRRTAVAYRELYATRGKA